MDNNIGIIHRFNMHNTQDSPVRRQFRTTQAQAQDQPPLENSSITDPGDEYFTYPDEETHGQHRNSESEPGVGVRNVVSSVVSGIAVLIGGLFCFVTLTKYDASERNMEPGLVLFAHDEHVRPQDHTLKFPLGAEHASMLIWDFAAEDGDEVVIEVNGVPITSPFKIQHRPTEVNVPVGGAVAVRGVKDGKGGGVTYAVRFPIIKKSIKNGIDPGGKNTYTLTFKAE